MMNHTLRLIALFFVFCCTTFAWTVLGAVMSNRSTQQSYELASRVSDLWGTPMAQQNVNLALRWTTLETRTAKVTDEKGRETTREELVAVEHQRPLQPASTRIKVDLHEDIRRKGLIWFPLYDIDFEGQWTLVHDGTETGQIDVTWPFPDANGYYDGFRLIVNGSDRTDTVTGQLARTTIPVRPGDEVQVIVRFASRGTEAWRFQPTTGVGELHDFQLAMTTDFPDIDYPSDTLAPSTRERTDDGWALAWSFDRLVSGKGMGMIVPCPIQPGELASALTWSAPISLGLFMVWIHILGLLKGIDVHPVHHAFLAAAFFSFHMLFGYSADRIPVEWAFGLSSAVSVLFVVTYLARAVSRRFALVEAGGAQLVYLVGFGAAHFSDGATGLTLTVIGIITLFALMQLTAHIRWSTAFGESPTMSPAK